MQTRVLQNKVRGTASTDYLLGKATRNRRSDRAHAMARLEAGRRQRLRQVKSTITCHLGTKVQATRDRRSKKRVGQQIIVSMPASQTERKAVGLAERRDSATQRRTPLSPRGSAPNNHIAAAIDRARTYAKQTEALAQQGTVVSGAVQRGTKIPGPSLQRQRPREPQRAAAEMKKAAGVTKPKRKGEILQHFGNGNVAIRFAGVEDPHADEDDEVTPECNSATPSTSSSAVQSGSESRASETASQERQGGGSPKGAGHLSTVRGLRRRSAGAREDEASSGLVEDELCSDEYESSDCGDYEDSGAEKDGEHTCDHIFGAGETPQLRAHLGLQSAVAMDSRALGSLDPNSALSLFDNTPAGAATNETEECNGAPEISGVVAAATTSSSPREAETHAVVKETGIVKQQQQMQQQETKNQHDQAEMQQHRQQHRQGQQQPAAAVSKPCRARLHVSSPDEAVAVAKKANCGPVNKGRSKPRKKPAQVRCSLDDLKAEHAEAMAILQELEGGRPSEVMVSDTPEEHATPAAGDPDSCSTLAQKALDAAQQALKPTTTEAVLLDPEHADEDEGGVDWAAAPVTTTAQPESPADSPAPPPQFPAGPHTGGCETSDTFFGAVSPNNKAFEIVPFSGQIVIEQEQDEGDQGEDQDDQNQS
eukprot:g5037.t1